MRCSTTPVALRPGSRAPGGRRLRRLSVASVCLDLPSVSPVKTDAVDGRQIANIPLEASREEFDFAILLDNAAPGAVLRQNDVRRGPQRIVRRQGLGAGYVQICAADPILLQGFAQRIFVDQGTAAEVGKNCVPFHQADSPTVEHVLRSGCFRGDAGDHVGGGHGLVECRLGPFASERRDAAAERCEQTGQPAADGPAAEDYHLALGENVQMRPIGRPDPFALRLQANHVVNASVQGQNAGKARFRDGICIESLQVGYADVLAGDVVPAVGVDPGGIKLQPPQPTGRCHPVCRHAAESDLGSKERLVRCRCDSGAVMEVHGMRSTDMSQPIRLRGVDFHEDINIHDLDSFGGIGELLPGRALVRGEPRPVHRSEGKRGVDAVRPVSANLLRPGRMLRSLQGRV